MSGKRPKNTNNKRVNLVLATNKPSTSVKSNFDKNFDNFLQMTKAEQYKKATLLKPEKGGATWFIIWYNYNPATEKLERVRKTFDLNRISDLQEREAVANNIVLALNKSLREGYNWFVPGPDQPAAIPEQKEMAVHWSNNVGKSEKTAIVLLTEQLEQKRPSLSPRSFNTYRSAVNLFAAYLSVSSLAEISANEVSPDIVNGFIKSRLNAGLENKSINGLCGLVGSLFSVLEKTFVIKKNPFSFIDRLKVKETDYFKSFTAAELQTIAAKLQAENERFFVFTQFIYYAYVRPYHIAFIKREQIDFENNIIKVYGKNRKLNSKQLLQPLKAALLAIGLDKLQPEQYLFSKDFMPSPVPYKTLSTRATELWHEYVITGLKIDKKMYGLKHTSGQLYISENEVVNMDWLQNQMEHSDLKQTSTYVKKRTIKKIDEDKTNFTKY